MRDYEDNDAIISSNSKT